MLPRSDYFRCVALDQIATEEPFSSGETPPDQGFAPSLKRAKDISRWDREWDTGL